MTKSAFDQAKRLFPVTSPPSNSAPEAEKTKHKIYLKVRQSLVMDDWPQKAAVTFALLEKDELPVFEQMAITDVAERIMYIYQAMMELVMVGLNPKDINKLMEEYHASLITNIDNTGRLRYNAHQQNFVETTNYKAADFASLLETAYKNKGMN